MKLSRVTIVCVTLHLTSTKKNLLLLRIPYKMWTVLKTICLNKPLVDREAWRKAAEYNTYTA